MTNTEKTDTNFQDENISLGNWETKYKPVQEDDSDKLFNFLEDAYKFADSKFNNKPYQHIWSVVDGDSQNVILNGYHKVNCYSYIVCSEPWGDGSDADSDIYIEVKYQD